MKLLKKNLALLLLSLALAVPCLAGDMATPGKTDPPPPPPSTTTESTSTSPTITIALLVLELILRP